MNFVDGEDWSGFWEDVAEPHHRAAAHLQTSVHRPSYCGCRCQSICRESRRKSRHSRNDRRVVFCEAAKPIPGARWSWQNWPVLCKLVFCLKVLQCFDAVGWVTEREFGPQSDSANRCIFYRRIILPNFIPIWFETTEHWLFLKMVAPTTTTGRTQWVA